MLLPPSRPSPPPTDAPVVAASGCVVCGEEARDGTVCSRDCAVEAERQVAANVAELRQLGRDRDARVRRRLVTSRNGRLTDAMLSWRPDDPQA